MCTDIFYFSGTGNSLFVAKQLGELLSDQVRILPVKNYVSDNKVKINECVILVCPVYFQTIPHIVKSFINKLEFGASSALIYGVATCNGGPGHSLFTMNRMLKKKGQSLRSGFCINMPGNSLIVRDFTNPPEVRAKRLAESYHQLMEISEVINNKRLRRIEGSDRIKYHLQGIITGAVAKYIYKTPARFKTTKACTKCMNCMRVCPCNNIKLGQQGVEWGNNCEYCLACFHWCPSSAIEIGNNTAGKLRYHHPDISLTDMFNNTKRKVL